MSLLDLSSDHKINLQKDTYCLMRRGLPWKGIQSSPSHTSKRSFLPSLFTLWSGDSKNFTFYYVQSSLLVEKVGFAGGCLWYFVWGQYLWCTGSVEWGGNEMTCTRSPIRLFVGFGITSSSPKVTRSRSWENLDVRAISEDSYWVWSFLTAVWLIGWVCLLGATLENKIFTHTHTPPCPMEKLCL